jgi:hypothetical protein
MYEVLVETHIAFLHLPLVANLNVRIVCKTHTTFVHRPSAAAL